MRIYIQPPHLSGSVEQSIQTAHQLLHESSIFSARLGSIINERGVLLIEARDIAKALAVLNDAGMRAVMN